jgi:biopolymer transport protein ExbD
MIFGGGKGGFHSGGGEGGDAAISLNLTALMDILSNLLFFLLAAYTAQSVEVEGHPDLHLPSSTSQVALNPQITITVTQNAIDVGGIPVAHVANGLITDPLDSDDKIAPLYDRMKQVRVSREAAGRADMADSSLILLLADKGTDSRTISTVLRSAGFAGFANVRFGVIAQ